MAKSYKLSGTGNYIDASGVIYNKKELPEYLDNAGGVPIGTILPFGSGSNLPTGFLECNGQFVSKTAYPDLYKVIGDAYNNSSNPNTSTYFCVPDLRMRVPVGQDTSKGYTIGKTGGEETHTMTLEELPEHYHFANNFVWNSATGLHRVNLGTGSSTLSYDSNGDTGLKTNNAGEGQPANNMQPYTVVGYMIKATTVIGTLDSVQSGAVVVDNLTSTSTTNALSANQGKILNDSLNAFKNNVDGWIELNNIGNNGAQITARYNKTLGLLGISGMCYYGSGTFVSSNTLIAQLPTGYRPSSTRTITAGAMSLEVDRNLTVPRDVTINTSGQIIVTGQNLGTDVSNRLSVQLMLNCSSWGIK